MKKPRLHMQGSMKYSGSSTWAMLRTGSWKSTLRLRKMFGQPSPFGVSVGVGFFGVWGNPMSVCP